jgi:hypothetical protein
MNGYWEQFSLYWTIRIFFLTFVEAFEDFEDQGVTHPGLDEENFRALMEKFSKTGVIPIITPEEMNLHLPDRSRAFRF